MKDYNNWIYILKICKEKYLVFCIEFVEQRMNSIGILLQYFVKICLSKIVIYEMYVIIQISFNYELRIKMI